MAEEMGSGGGGGEWWWAAASAAQMAAGVVSYRRGCGPSGAAMPFKAFAVASLFVGAAATAAAGTLRGSGIHKVDDLKRVGEDIRRGIRAPPRKTN
ncbi:hypothetical protein QJS04_geneDACA018426 [Acorus gramineus]|uniref:Uncharacterized protein n=1 Tax=Acorus gramineus TaxID=55184 RepID=A0AAV9AEB3_ACOGR|nr:hypothetical protein QJS04_geneDACA018426 [Acorus gramineus]